MGGMAAYQYYLIYWCRMQRFSTEQEKMCIQTESAVMQSNYLLGTPYRHRCATACACHQPENQAFYAKP